MIKTLDLHGVKHEDVDRLVENFVLLNSPPMKIITGNSERMMELTLDVLDMAQQMLGIQDDEE